MPRLQRVMHFLCRGWKGSVRSKLTLVVAAIIFVCAGRPLSAQRWSGVLAPSRAVDWSTAGVPGGIPTRTASCASLAAGASAAQINSAIANCAAGQVVQLAAGTYNLSTGLLFNNKRNVTLRGAGADRTLLVFSGNNSCGGVGGDICFINGDANWIGGPGNTANWTAGYARGATQITLSSTANLKVGTLVNLDQLEDSSDDGTVFQASNANSHNCLNCNYAGRKGRPQTQIVKVTAITGNVVTITPGLYLPNWRADRSPGAWWSSDTPISGSGVEDLSIDSGNVKTGGAIVAFYNAYGCWLKGVRTMNAFDSHVKFWQSAHVTVSDSYFFANQVARSQSYGTDTYLAADNLIENNIFHHVTVPNMNETSQGDVYAYNYSINNFFGTNGVESGTALHSAYTHAAGNAYFLWEGNDYDGISLENFHGPAHFVTAFRNRFAGREPSKSDRTSPVINQSYQRFTNIVGNVLGLAGYHTNYTSKFGDAQNTSTCNRSIYALGWSGNCANWAQADCSGYAGCPNPDALVAVTLVRWGNWDTVSNAARFVAAEVPSALASHANPVPPNQTLPASFYLSSRPGWWPSAVAWPPIGPEVSGGDLPNVGGHAFRIPARLCFENVMKGTFADSTARTFNAAACYGSGSTSTRPAPPTNVRIIRP